MYQTLHRPLHQPSHQPNSAIAHQVELAEDVGATLHIEPNDTPRAGEKVLAWFALTQRGGQSIPLSDCNCQIHVYAHSDKENPIATPTPEPVSSEGYQNIPGAQFTFPEVGAYRLTISGHPRGNGRFSPFDLAFDVTVAAGSSANAQANQEPAEASTERSLATPTVEESTGETGKLIGTGVVGAAIVGSAIGAIALKRKRS